MNEKNIIKLCSRCATKEVTEWVNDNLNDLPVEASKLIREELKAIRLVEGECLVCKRSTVAENIFDRVLSIIEKNNVNPDLKEQFKKSFGFSYVEEIPCILL